MGILFLHLSDLHFDNKHEDIFYQRLARSIAKNIKETMRNEKVTDEAIQYVFTSGDITATAHYKEFENARTFYSTLSDYLLTLKQQFLFTPGNHDVALNQADDAYTPNASEDTRKRQVEAKSGPYYNFLDSFLPRGAQIYRNSEFGCYIQDYEHSKLSVGIINSCEAESDKKHFGFIGNEQLSYLERSWGSERYNNWVKILLLHHNPVTVPNEQEIVDDFEKNQRHDGNKPEEFVHNALFLKNSDKLKNLAQKRSINMILHGHRHESHIVGWNWQHDKSGNSIGATQVIGAGKLSASKDGNDIKPSFNLIFIDPDKRVLKIWHFSYDNNQHDNILEQGSFQKSSVSPNPRTISYNNKPPIRGGVVPINRLRNNTKIDGEVFAAELLTQNIVFEKPKDDQINITINRDKVSEAVISTKGKKLLSQTYVLPNMPELMAIDNGIQRYLTRNNLHQGPISLENHPLRWASGGVLPIVNFKDEDKKYVPLLFRDIKPYGWNIPLGSSERQEIDKDKNLMDNEILEDELCNPWKMVMREFLEELLILQNSPRGGAAQNKRLFKSRFADRITRQSNELIQIHYEKRCGNPDRFNIDDKNGRVINLDKESTNINLNVIKDGALVSDNNNDGVLVCFNFMELGIEIVSVISFEIDKGNYFLDGEILYDPNGDQLVRMPFALFSLEYLERIFGNNPDFQYIDGPEIPPQGEGNMRENPSVRGAEITKNDIILFTWDLEQRVNYLYDYRGEKKFATNINEYNRYQKWVWNFGEDTFLRYNQQSNRYEMLYNDGKPVNDNRNALQNLHIFTPATAKILNLYFNDLKIGNGE
ncbi:MAG: metallophosphoesterase [Proteobacteria bacterium]|nr:metallophosphoesterase [Pseudomonadota bacterium]